MKRPIKPRPKKKPSVFDELYNRLQDNDTAYVLKHLMQYMPPPTRSRPEFLEWLVSRFDCEIKTLQINYPTHISYRVTLSFTDRSQKPLYGYLYPSKTVVTTSTTMVKAAILAYIQLCKQFGRFL